jgi:hypothetical protein
MTELNPQHAQVVLCENPDAILSAQPDFEAADDSTKKVQLFNTFAKIELTK